MLKVLVLGSSAFKDFKVIILIYIQLPDYTRCVYPDELLSHE